MGSRDDPGLVREMRDPSRKADIGRRCPLFTRIAASVLSGGMRPSGRRCRDFRLPRRHLMWRRVLAPLASFGLLAGCDGPRSVAPELTPGAASAAATPSSAPAEPSNAVAVAQSETRI